MTDRNIRQAVPFFMVTDIDRSIAFYQEGLGFEMKKDCPNGKIEWCYMEREGVAQIHRWHKEWERLYRIS